MNFFRFDALSWNAVHLPLTLAFFKDKLGYISTFLQVVHFCAAD
jgi:hypothetical protein